LAQTNNKRDERYHGYALLGLLDYPVFSAIATREADFDDGHKTTDWGNIWLPVALIVSNRRGRVHRRYHRKILVGLRRSAWLAKRNTSV
jgi:hypothetical protein